MKQSVWSLAKTFLLTALRFVAMGLVMALAAAVSFA